jgi:cytochrome c553
VRTLKIGLISTLAVLAVCTGSIAEENSGQRATSYVPRLSDLMVVIQIRHAKLFYAVRRGNWPLADYELEQLISTLSEAGRYYPKTTPPMTVADSIRTSLGEAIKAKDEAKFDRAFDEMNAGCNRCHEAADRPFIVIRRPSYPSAFSNQLYSPHSTEQQKRGH